MVKPKELEAADGSIDLEEFLKSIDPESIFNFTNSKTLLEIKSSLTLDEIIENSLTNLKTILENLRPDENFDETLEVISRTVFDEKKKHEEQINFNFEITFPGTDLERKNIALFCLACAACVQAKHQILSDNRDGAWALVTYANLLIGRAEESFEQERKALEALSRQSKGGEATKEKHLVIRNEVIRMLRELAPPTGWKNKKRAAEVIGEKLENFIIKNNLGDIVTLPVATVTTLLYRLEEMEIQAAFESSSAKHKIKKAKDPESYSISNIQATHKASRKQ
ncbi:hypothetical protein [Pseudomonas syringae]|uniref:hypothetical protein n=1 Tax=Pseudomonas syringae TaxID=317 RepID=UPI000FFF4102|nr:hypothetical protein [Pseudomonas syringae]MCK9780075.1 hypothetical protein [Pseudomonas syringae pv. syringae]RXF66830.1 hypothetical protein BKM77_03700 [Pseudomonas syringae]